MKMTKSDWVEMGALVAIVLGMGAIIQYGWAFIQIMTIGFAIALGIALSYHLVVMATPVAVEAIPVVVSIYTNMKMYAYSVVGTAVFVLVLKWAGLGTIATLAAVTVATLPLVGTALASLVILATMRLDYLILIVALTIYLVALFFTPATRNFLRSLREDENE